MRYFVTANLVLLLFSIIFAYKFNDKFHDMQEKNDKKSPVTIGSYYSSLGKMEKSELIKFLMVQYGFKYSTLQAKLNGRQRFNPRDFLIVQTVIKEQLWKSK